MRVSFEVNTHLVSDICQDNKKLVDIFYSVGIISDSERFGASLLHNIYP